MERRHRILLAIIILIAGLGISALRYHSTRAPLADLAWIEQNRTPRDSAMYASALYHAAHARQTLQTKWTAGGFAMHAVVAGIVGLALLLVPGRRPEGE